MGPWERSVQKSVASPAATRRHPLSRVLPLSRDFAPPSVRRAGAPRPHEQRCGRRRRRRQRAHHRALVTARLARVCRCPLPERRHFARWDGRPLAPPSWHVRPRRRCCSCRLCCRRHCRLCDRSTYGWAGGHAPPRPVPARGSAPGSGERARGRRSQPAGCGGAQPVLTLSVHSTAPNPAALCCVPQNTGMYVQNTTDFRQRQPEGLTLHTAPHAPTNCPACRPTYLA